MLVLAPLCRSWHPRPRPGRVAKHGDARVTVGEKTGGRPTVGSSRASAAELWRRDGNRLWCSCCRTSRSPRCIRVRTVGRRSSGPAEILPEAARVDPLASRTSVGRPGILHDRSTTRCTTRAGHCCSTATGILLGRRELFRYYASLDNAPLQVCEARGALVYALQVAARGDCILDNFRGRARPPRRATGLPRRRRDERRSRTRRRARDVTRRCHF
mmetsp:Transcript_18085/g.45337  ORF Transcript_18085/g.45337 Transcript_18085/m.45337 type:complete len:215 (-) Transcript_18085:3303-3947(-)